MFELNDDLPKLLNHKSALGEFILSSDSIGHTYSKTKRTNWIVQQIPEEEIYEFFRLCSTIGAYIIFPANKIDNQMTINGARGFHSKIIDRFDLTLECIKRYYSNVECPLSNALQRYKDFFKLFVDFSGYIHYFLLQDMVFGENMEIKFFLPFNEFNSSPIPATLEEYLIYKQNVVNFIKARNRRITEYQNNLLK